MAGSLDAALPVHPALVVGLALVLLVLVFRSLLVLLVGVLAYCSPSEPRSAPRSRCSSGDGWPTW